MAKISIIVPVYNTSKYIKKCLDSLVNQTLEDIEIVIINDGSTDNSKEIVMQYIEQYPNRILFIDKKNEGQAVARNIGINRCSGKYIGFVDSDDYVEVNMYEEMYSEAERINADLVECNYSFIDEECRELKSYGHVRQYLDKKDMFINPLVSPWNKIYRRSVIIDKEIIFPEGFIYEDTAFFIKTIPYMENRGFIDKKFVKHILHKQSTMKSNTGSKVADIFPVLKDCLEFYKDKKIYSEYREELEYFYVKILLCSSMQRISRVSDRRLRKELINKTFIDIETNCTKYKKNKYIQGGTKNYYMRNVNRFSASIFSMILRIID